MNIEPKFPLYKNKQNLYRILETACCPSHIAASGFVENSGQQKKVGVYSGGGVLGVDGDLVAGGQPGRRFEGGRQAVHAETG